MAGEGRRRLRLLPTLALAAAILLVPAAVYAWGRSSAVFSVEKVQVSGAGLVSPARVRHRLEKAYLGKNLFAVNAAGVRATLSRFSYIETVSVDRSFPGTLKVRVIEYRPAAYALAAGRWYVVADDGHVVREVGTAPAKAGASGPPAPAATLSPAPSTSAHSGRHAHAGPHAHP